MSKKGFSPTRLILKACIPFAVALVILSQIPGPAGKPAISLADLNPLSLISALYKDAEKAITTAWYTANQWISGEEVTGKRQVFVYRYRDSRGILQFSQTPPTHTDQYEKVEIVDNAFVMSAPDEKLTNILEENLQKREGKSSAAQNQPTFSAAPEKVQKMMQDIKKIQTNQEEKEKQLRHL